MSDLLKSLKRDMDALHQAGLVSETTMRDFDQTCLTPVEPITSVEIKRIRTANHVSQAVFARYLNMSKESVQKWERGEKQPTGAALKLLALVRDKGLEAIS